MSYSFTRVGCTKCKIQFMAKYRQVDYTCPGCNAKDDNILMKSDIVEKIYNDEKLSSEELLFICKNYV